jgi:hypothetical protein
LEIKLSKDHIYTVDGKVYPGVTTILGDVYGRFPYPEGSAERGHHVHLATQLYDEDDLDEATLDPLVAGYLEGWKRFREEMDFQVKQIELKVHNSVYGYCGTLDRIGTMQGRLYLIDIKSGAKAFWHRIQTAAYALCLPPDTVFKRASVYLSAEGKYKIDYYINKQDYHDWLSTYRVYQIKKENNL